MAESTGSCQHADMSGWLFKWTNYLRGYQKRWFVLSNGYLSYYRNEDEMDHSYRGSIYMHGATVFSDEPNMFIVSNGDTYRIKTTNETEKQRWIGALESAKHAPAGNLSNPTLPALTGRLKGKLEDLHKYQAILEYHGHALQSSLSAIEVSSSFETITPNIKEINEQAAVFRASTSALIKACSDYLDLAVRQSDKWLKLRQTGNHKRVWPENVVALMRRLSLNKHDAIKDTRKSSSDNENSVDSSFKTDVDPGPSCSGVTKSTVLMYPAIAGNSKKSKTPDGGGTNPPEEGSKQTADTSVSIRGEGGTKKHKEGRKKYDRAKSVPPESDNSLVIAPSRLRRSQIPDRPQSSMNLWSIIKNHVGKDLSKMPVPINFSEPLSLLQRLTEDFEHAHILDRASHLSDPAEQIAHVAGFAISGYSSTPYRTTKPFNPLLGETYECDRVGDLGWKSIAEQVSHHPPISALHCEGNQWVCWLDQSMTTKFQGQNLSFIPSGDIHLKFNNGNHYVWNKVTSNIHNVIIGKLWLDQEGDMNIKCFTNGFTCKVSFLSPGYFGGEPHKVKGVVFDKDGHTKLHIIGGYDSKVEIVRKDDLHNKTSKHPHNEVIWCRRALQDGSDKYYNFTVFACQLNEMEDGIAPTDSRNRPDQRFMENGQWEDATKKKTELEEQQRAERRKLEEAYGTEKTHVPVWFQKENDPNTNKDMYVYKGEYWRCKMSKNWSRCPAIFS